MYSAIVYWSLPLWSQAKHSEYEVKEDTVPAPQEFMG